jgi:hypothetical protein
MCIICPTIEKVEAKVVEPFGDADGRPGTIEINGEEFNFAFTPAACLPPMVRTEVQLWNESEDLWVSLDRAGRLDCGCEHHCNLFPIEGTYCPHIVGLVQAKVLEDFNIEVEEQEQPVEVAF